MQALKKLEDLQAKLKSRCHVFVEHEHYFGWGAGIKSDGNQYPYWIQYHAETPAKALKKLFKFFDGKLEDHANHKRTAKDFLA